MGKQVHREISALLHKMRQEELNASESVRLKSLCADDPFLTDAIEGLSLLKPEERIARIASIELSLKVLLEKREKKQPVLIVLRRAAAVAVIIIGIWAVWQAFPNNESQLAMQQNEHNTSDTDMASEADSDGSGTMSSVEKNMRIATNKIKREFEKTEAPSTSDSENNMGGQMSEVTPDEEGNQSAIALAEDERQIDSEAKKQNLPDETGQSITEEKKQNVTSIAAAAKREPSVKNSSSQEQLKSETLPSEVAAIDEEESSKLMNADQQIERQNTATGNTQRRMIPRDINPNAMGIDQVAGAGNVDTDLSKKRVITGSVKDESGEPLIGANIVIQGMKFGTVTDFDGQYELKIPDEIDLSNPVILMIAYTGYALQSVLLEEETSMDFVLQEGVSLSEVAVVSRRSRKKATALGYGIKNISSDSMEQDSKKSKNQGPNRVSRAMAEPVNGWKSYYKYVRKNIVVPEAAKLDKIEGTVMVEFDLKSDGTPHNFRITQSLGYGCDEEAIRLVQEGPKWDVENAQVSIGGLSIDF